MAQDWCALVIAGGRTDHADRAASPISLTPRLRVLRCSAFSELSRNPIGDALAEVSSSACLTFVGTGVTMLFVPARMARMSADVAPSQVVWQEFETCRMASGERFVSWIPGIIMLPGCHLAGSIVDSLGQIYKNRWRTADLRCTVMT
jgi:hypothetical protein